MSALRYRASARTRIGAVPFLNATPLVYGLEDRVQFFPPNELSDAFRSGQIDVGLLPIVEYFKYDNHLLVPHMAIGSCGPVESVKLFLNKPLKALRVVGVDRRSRTSALLLRVLLETRYKVTPKYVILKNVREAPPLEYDALMIIGDEAIRHDTTADSIDLGDEWTQWTGLPFVFACWQVRRGFTDGATIEMLHNAALEGTSKIEQIASLVPGFSPHFVKRYLSECICYDFGEDHERAIEIFVHFLTQLNVPIQEKKLAYFDRHDLGKGLIRVKT
jgi:chorismate dehydratase